MQSGRVPGVVASAGIGLLQKQKGELLVRSHELPDVVLIDRLELPPPRRRRLEKLERLFDGLRRGPTVADQESAVANDAIADLAEARQENGQPLL
jgi:hypothetical protein